MSTSALAQLLQDSELLAEAEEEADLAATAAVDSAAAAATGEMGAATTAPAAALAAMEEVITVAGAAQFMAPQEEAAILILQRLSQLPLIIFLVRLFLTLFPAEAAMAAKATALVERALEVSAMEAWAAMMEARALVALAAPEALLIPRAGGLAAFLLLVLVLTALQVG